MANKFLYIDDNTPENAKGIIDGLEKGEELMIVFENPKGNWEKERERVLSVDFKEYNGLILDLNLEETPNQEKQTSRYKGSSLAQEIRNLSKAGKIKEIPIILFSATANLNMYFDRTNEDLFDIIVPREKLNDIQAFVAMRQKLISLSIGYELIAKCKSENNNLLELFKYELTKEDIRFVSEMKTVLELPTHTISNFIIKNILEKSNVPITGVLISENILATRLGIDIAKSNNWKDILEKLERHRYKGVFSEGWKMWWASGLESWWTNELQIKESLRSTRGSHKVEILKDKLELTELVVLTKADKAKSETFWTNCIGSGVSIDTIDGLLVVGQDNNFPWQDKNYVSIDEALVPKRTICDWKDISPFEKYKLELIKEQYPNERPPR